MFLSPNMSKHDLISQWNLVICQVSKIFNFDKNSSENEQKISHMSNSIIYKTGVLIRSSEH